MILRQIRYFQAVVQFDSFTEAAEECHISQSAISQQIASLESELNVKLITRHNRKFSLTPAGKYFYKKSLIISAEIEQMCRETVRLARQNTSQFTIGYLKSFESLELKKAVAEFSSRYPNITVQTESLNHEGLYDMLRFGNADIVLNDQRRAFSDEYINLVLAECFSFVEISAVSPLAKLDTLEIKDIKNSPCILVASKEEQEDEEEYYREIIGFHGDFLFAENQEDARLLVIANRGVMPVDRVENTSENSDDLIKKIPLCRNEKQIKKNYCAFWKADNSDKHVLEFAEILKNFFK